MHLHKILIDKILYFRICNFSFSVGTQVVIVPPAFFLIGLNLNFPSIIIYLPWHPLTTAVSVGDSSVAPPPVVISASPLISLMAYWRMRQVISMHQHVHYLQLLSPSIKMQPLTWWEEYSHRRRWMEHSGLRRYRERSSGKTVRWRYQLFSAVHRCHQ